MNRKQKGRKPKLKGKTREEEKKDRMQVPLLESTRARSNHLAATVVVGLERQPRG